MPDSHAEGVHALLTPGRYHEALRMWFVPCECGASPGQREGILSAHFPRFYSGRTRLTDPFGVAATCRYSGRTLTLAAAIRRDSQLTRAEAHAKRSAGTNLAE